MWLQGYIAIKFAADLMDEPDMNPDEGRELLRDRGNEHVYYNKRKIVNNRT